MHYPTIDHTIFDKEKYQELLQKILDHTRKFLTTESLGKYVLETIGYKGTRKVLLLSGNIGPDLQRDSLLLGLRQLLGSRLVDHPKVAFLYKNYTGSEQDRLLSLPKVLDDIPMDRNNIESRLREGEFDLVIYGSVHRGLPFLNTVKSNLSPDRIVYVCGEDAHRCSYLSLPCIFLREFDPVYDWYDDKFTTHIRAITSSSNNQAAAHH